MYDLIILIMRYYLRNHVGRMASVKIRSTIDIIRDADQNELSKKVINQIVNDFGERDSLLEELSLKLPSFE